VPIGEQLPIFGTVSCFVDRASRYIRVSNTKSMHYLSSVSFFNQPLHNNRIILNSVCQHNHFITQGNYKTYSEVTSTPYTASHSSKNNQTTTGLIFANGEEQHTVKNFKYFNFLDIICIIHFTRQMIQFYVSNSFENTICTSRP